MTFAPAESASVSTADVPAIDRNKAGGVTSSAGPRPFRVLVVDDHTIVREGIVSLLNQAPDLTVCAQASNSREAFVAARLEKPDIAVVDYFLGDTDDGPRLIENLASMGPSMRILALSFTQDDSIAERALRSGALGFLSKHEGTKHLLEAVRVVGRGDRFITPELRVRLGLSSELPSDIGSAQGAYGRLSHREMQVFQMLGTGLPISAIAFRLGLSVKTVGTHREHLKSKLGCETADEVTAKASAWLRGGGGR
jgi:DNA-binding NarL/FixJ family response regulator